MAEQPTLTVNGRLATWSKTEITIADVDGDPLPPIRGGFKSLTFSYGVEGDDNEMGNQDESVGKKEGHPTYSASMDMFENAWTKLRDQLGAGYMEKRIVVTAAYKYRDDTNTEVSDKVTINCKLGQTTGNWAQGSSHGRSFTLSVFPSGIREGSTQYDPFHEN
jgi:hypothetical protein